MKKILIALILLLSINVYADFTETVCVGSSCFSSTNLTINGDSGTATYDPSTKTITLNNFKYHGYGHNTNTLYQFQVNYYYSLIYSNEDLNIIINGENELSIPDTSNDYDNYYFNFVDASDNTLTINGTNKNNDKLTFKLSNVSREVMGEEFSYATFFSAKEVLINNIDLSMVQNTEKAYKFFGIHVFYGDKFEFNNGNFYMNINHDDENGNGFYGIYGMESIKFKNSNIDINLKKSYYSGSNMFMSRKSLIFDNCIMNINGPLLRSIFSLVWNTGDKSVLELIGGEINIKSTNLLIHGDNNSKVIFDNIKLSYDGSTTFIESGYKIQTEFNNYPDTISPVYTSRNTGKTMLFSTELERYYDIENLRFVESGELTSSITSLNEYYELTEEDQNYIKAGNDITVSIISEELTDPTESIINSVNNKKGNGTIIGYYNIEVVKEAETTSIISNLKQEMTQEITIDDQYINNDPKVTRTYKVIRIHGDDVDTLDATFNPTTKKLTFKSDKYSVFAVAYYDSNISNPKTGDNLIIYILLSIISFLLLITINKRTIRI